MAKITAKIIGSGTTDDPYRVNLPTYSMIKENTARLANGKFPAGATVDIEVPDDELNTAKTRPDTGKIRAKYRGQAKWDRANVGSDV